MLTKLRLHKIITVQLITLIVLISSCLQITQQRPVPLNFLDFNSFNHFQPFNQFQPAFQQFPIKQQQQRNFTPNNNSPFQQFQQQRQLQQPVQQNFNQNLNSPASQQLQRPPIRRQNVIQGSNLNNQKWLNPGQDLIFATTTAAPTTTAVVIVNNQPAVPTMVPFIPAATTPTPQFLDCFSRCPTTSEFNPICASNREQYGNEQKFNCARRCGADIQIVRRGSCQGLFPMSRG